MGKYIKQQRTELNVNIFLNDKKLIFYFKTNGDKTTLGCDTKISRSDKLKFYCEKCGSSNEQNSLVVRGKIKNKKSLLCKKCINVIAKKKEMQTRIRNGTTMKELIAEGKAHSFKNVDQSKNSEIRKKMNETKIRNDTFGYKGSETYNKSLETKTKNGTLNHQVKPGFMKMTKEERKLWSGKTKPGFLKWGFKERSEHSKKLFEKLRTTVDEQTGKTLLELANDKRRATTGKGLDKTDFEKYLGVVRKLTEANDLTVLDNFEKRGRSDLVEDAYHLDHKVSIFEGFINDIAPEVIANINNLEMLPASINCSKGKKSSMLLDDLLKLIN